MERRRLGSMGGPCRVHGKEGKEKDWQGGFIHGEGRTAKLGSSRNMRLCRGVSCVGGGGGGDRKESTTARGRNLSK